MRNISIAFIVLFFSSQNFCVAESLAKTAAIKSAYEENIVSLKDLTGVYVVLDYVKSASQKSNLSVNPNLQQEINKRLESVGLKLLSKEEMLQTKGNPQLDIYPNYPAHLSAPANSDSESVVANLSPSRQCCYTSVWGSFSQGAIIERNPGSKYRLSTWGNGSNTDTCERLGDWMSDATLKIIDNFIADYKKSKESKQQAQNKPEPKTIASDSASEQISQKQYMQVRKMDDTKGMACDTAFIIYAEIFKAGSSAISNAKGSILDNLSSHMQACNNYRYRIETHSDQRASHEANELLSARRAIAIHNYLVDKGVDEEQFEMRFFGDRKPMSKGSTEEDYAVNRRVVITPISQK